MAAAQTAHLVLPRPQANPSAKTPKAVFAKPWTNLYKKKVN